MRLTLMFIAVAIRCCLSDVLIIGNDLIKEHSEAKNWKDASGVCKANSGHLLRDGPEFHSQLPAGTFWLDKMNIATTGWAWTDGSVVEGKFWAQREHCIVVKDGSWQIEDCTSKHKFLCQRSWSWEDEGFDTTTAKGRALKFFHTTTTWDDAKAKCGNLIKPGYLITVNNEAVNNWVMGKSVKTWIGLNDKAAEGKHVWDSGKPLSYTNYMSTGLVDAGGHTENCVVANWPNSNGRHALTWNDIPCGSTSYARAYACEIWL